MSFFVVLSKTDVDSFAALVDSRSDQDEKMKEQYIRILHVLLMILQL